MSTPLARDLARMPCPHCPESLGLELALRLELETEREVVFAACLICNRLYEVSAGGELRFDTGELRALTCRKVSCPHCRSVGYALSYAVPKARAESHLILTCRDCQHTFCPDEDELLEPNPRDGGQAGGGFTA